MKRGKPLRRKTRLRPLGKRAAYNLEFRQVREEARKRANDYCEAHIEGICKVWGSDGHHKLMRSHGGKNTLANIAWLCRDCHSHIHLNPAWSYETGWLIRGV